MEKENTRPEVQETSPENEGAHVYELGYHLIPTLTTAEIEQEVSLLKEHIEKNGGTIISEGQPALVDLAYTMVKKQEGKNAPFDKAYFGWIKFEGTGEAAVAVKEGTDGHKNILRFIVIKTVREYVPPKQRTYLRTVSEGSRTISKPEVVEKKENVEPMSEEELDTAIEELVAEK